MERQRATAGRIALLLALLASLGPLAAPSAAAGKATSAAAFAGAGPLSGNLFATETAGTLRLHAIVANSSSLPMEEVSFNYAVRPCSSAPGAQLAVPLGDIPPGGDHIVGTVDTNTTGPVLPRARSLRILSKGEQIGCVRPARLRPARKGGRRKPTTLVANWLGDLHQPLEGVLVLTRDKGGSLRHTETYATQPARDVSAGGATARAPWARASLFHTIDWTFVGKGGATAAAYRTPYQDAAAVFSQGTTSVEHRVAPRARKLRIEVDGDPLVVRAVRRYTVIS